MPLGVVNYLTEMKNLLELMIDLSYSSILFNDKTMAEDVFELEEKMDVLLQNMSREIMLSRLPPNEVETMLPVLKIASASEEVSDSLRNVAEVSYHKLDKHPVILEALEETKSRPYRLVANQKSPYLNTAISTDELITKTSFRLLGFKKNGGDWVYNPDKTPKIKSGDIIILKGPTRNKQKLEKYLRISLP